MYGQKDIWMDRRTYGWTEGHMDRLEGQNIKK